MFRNIIFDLDGTLVDSKRDIAAAQHWVLGRLGVHSYKPEELYPLIGKPLAETFATILPAPLHKRIPEAIELYKNRYPPRALETTTLFPGVRETLEALRARGIRLATATTKLSAGTRRVRRTSGSQGTLLRSREATIFRLNPTHSLSRKFWKINPGREVRA